MLYLWDADYPWDVRTAKICRSLTQAGYEVHIVARNRDRRPILERLKEGTVHRMAPIRWLPQAVDRVLGFPAFANPRWIRLLRQSLVRTAPDVLIVRDLPLCPMAIRASRRAGIPLVLDMAENYPAMIQAVWSAGRQKPWDILVRNPRIVRWVERRCLPRLDHVWVVVEESARRLEAAGLTADRITVVSNTPLASQVQRNGSRPRRPEGELHLVYLGLLEMPRGIAVLLEAVSRLRQSGVAARLDLMGDGRDRTLLEARARDLGLAHEVATFHGFVPNDQAIGLLARADVGVIPHVADEAWNTTVPNKLFDYMAAGLPVLTSDAIPAARIVRETGSGLVFRSGDAGDLVQQVRSLLDPETRDRMGSAGRRAIAARYNWEEAVRAMSSSLHRLMGNATDRNGPTRTDQAQS